MYLKRLAADFLKAGIRKNKKMILGDFTVNALADDQMGFGRGTPIDRYYLDSFLSTHSEYIKGDVLEIAEDTYTKKYGDPDCNSNIMTFDKNQDSQNVFHGDLRDSTTLPKQKFDCFVFTQTLNFIFEKELALSGCIEVLKPGGVLLGTVAGLMQISRYDMDRWGDYWRFTDMSIRHLLSDYFKGGVEVIPYGNLQAALAMLQGFCIEDFKDKSILENQDPDYQILIGFRAIKN